jgi:hypothetical protein
MFDKEEVTKRLTFATRECGTYIGNYLFFYSKGFDLCNNKIAFVLDLPLCPSKEIEYINLLFDQPESTQKFLDEINKTKGILKIVLLDKSSFCLIKSALLNWKGLENRIIGLIKSIYLDQSESIEIKRVLFGTKEEEMAKVVRELSEKRFPETIIEQALSMLKNDLGP